MSKSNMCCHGNLFYAFNWGVSHSFHDYLATREIEHVKNFTVCIRSRNDYSYYSCILFKYWAKNFKSKSSVHLKTKGKNVRKLQSGESFMNLGCITIKRPHAKYLKNMLSRGMVIWEWITLTKGDNVKWYHNNPISMWSRL